MGTAFPHNKLSGNGVPTRGILRLFCIITIKFLTVNNYVTTFSGPQTMSKLDTRICKALEIVPLKHISKGACSIYIVEGFRGAIVGGVGGVATPPEFWKGGLNPPDF